MVLDRRDHALVVATGAEIPGLAGEREQRVVPAAVAVDSGKAKVRIAAFEEAPDHLLFDRSAKPPRVAKLTCVAREWGHYIRIRALAEPLCEPRSTQKKGCVNVTQPCSS